MTLSDTGMRREKMQKEEMQEGKGGRKKKERGRDKGVKIKGRGKMIERKGEATCWL